MQTTVLFIVMLACLVLGLISARRCRSNYYNYRRLAIFHRRGLANVHEVDQCATHTYHQLLTAFFFIGAFIVTLIIFINRW